MDKKPEKMVPEVRFKGFTDDWEQRKLGESLSLLKDGTHGSYESVQQGAWLLSAKNIINNRVVITSNDRKISENDFKKIHDKFQLRKGDVLLTIVGTIGRSAILKEANKLTFQRSVAYLRPDENILTSSDFLFSLSKSSNFQNQLKKRTVISAQPGIYLSDIDKLNITIPEIKKEQDKIASIIITIDNILSLQQRKLEQLRQLKIFTLQRMFIDKDCKQPILRFKNFKDNWLPHKFNDIANTFSGGTPAISNKDYYGGNIPFIRSAEINKNTTQLHLTPDGLKNSSAKFIKKGTLLYALYGATSGEVGIAQIDGAINQAVMAINLKKDNVYFIKTWLIKNKRKIISTYLQGGQGNLSAKIVKHLKLSLPKIEEENLISITIMKIDSLIKLQQSKIDDLVNLKKYLLQKLFI